MESGSKDLHFHRELISEGITTVRVMILPESSGWANLKSKAACCQVATNLADRDWELLLRIDYKPHPNCTAFTKLGYPVFSKWMLLYRWPKIQWLPCVPTHTDGCCFVTGKQIQCNTYKDLSHDFASRSFVGWLSLRMLSSAVICQSAVCVIWIHMLIAVYTCVSYRYIVHYPCQCEVLHIVNIFIFRCT